MDSDKCLFPRPQISKFPTKQQYMSNPLDSPCTSAYSKTTGNCQDSESSSSSSSSSSDQSDNVYNASGLGMQAMKRRRQAVHSHKLSYKRRRDKINKRMRALRNLIPNCSKLDNESVLDEAIEYLKSLQLQLQIMPTFAGLCVPPTPIMFPTLGNAIDLRLRAGGLQLFGLPLAGYGSRLQMPMNALPAQQP